MGTIAEKLLRVKETKTGFKDLITEKGGVITETTTFHEYIDEARKLMNGESGLPLQAATEEEMNNLLLDENIGKVFLYTGETNENFTNGEYYIIEEVAE